MKKSNNEDLCRWIGDLRSKENEAINVLPFCCKPLKNDFQKLFLIGGKIFHYFWVTLHDVIKLYMYHKVH